MAAALLTQRSLASHTQAQGGHFLMVVEGNQPELEQALATWIAGSRPAVTAVRVRHFEANVGCALTLFAVHPRRL
jgi:hypothetical protein